RRDSPEPGLGALTPLGAGVRLLCVRRYGHGSCLDTLERWATPYLNPGVAHRMADCVTWA
ncbi:hypothetical protein GA0115233_109629, partial [Streptomyces sp. DI166]